MPTLAEKKQCTGCAACYSKCAKSAITMTADQTGFLYPSVKAEVCIECGACTKACPVIEDVDISINDPQAAYVLRHKDDKVRGESTSGGAFTAIAQTVLKRGGVVFGAAFNDEMKVIHCYVDNEGELYKFRNSKYVQSEIGNTFREAKAFLKEGRWVCYSGTPCQIHGLLKYLAGIDQSKLITVDLVCHCVPSPLIFEKYVDYQKKKLGNFNSLVFRDKGRGYSYSTMAIYKDGACAYRNGSESDLWFRAFLHGFCDRDSCSECRFQKWPRQTDLTIWECFTVSKLAPEMDDNKGATSVIAWTDKGNGIIKDNESLDIIMVDPSVFRKKIDREHFDDLMTIDKQQMYQDAHQLDSVAFFNKYLPNTLTIKTKRVLRMSLYYTGLYGLVKKILG